MMTMQSKPCGPTRSEKVAAIFSRPKYILFVDDDQRINELAREITQSFRADLTIATSVGEARDAINSGIPFDVVFLDVRLTNGNGVELYREIAARFPKLKVIFMTAFFSDELQSKIEAIGPARVYSKPRLLDLRFLRQLFAQIGIGERQRAGVA